MPLKIKKNIHDINFCLNSLHKVNYCFAQSKILLYNNLEILLTYNYKTFTSGRTNQNKRKIIRIDLPSYMKF